MDEIARHRVVQDQARCVISQLAPTICPEDTERSLAERAVGFLAEGGISATWYYECPALVLLGSRSELSLSGRDYVPSDEEQVGEENLITIDLSPLQGGAWGDFARSLVVEEGCWVEEPCSSAFRLGLHTIKKIHRAVRQFATPWTSFEELHAYASDLIQESGFENLDFAGNLGHSIEARLEDRLYLEPGNTKLLRDVSLFTFEPHLRRIGGRWGFKHEDIYYFSEEELCPL